MWKNILDYPFRSGGAPLDASGANNHGAATAISFGFDGAQPGSGFFHFDGAQGRVHVPYNETWNDLVGVRVEALVRIDQFKQFSPLKKRHTIVDGSNSFSFWVGGMGFVGAACLGKRDTADEPSSDGDLNSLVAPEFEEFEDNVEWKTISTLGKYGLEDTPRKIQSGQWVKLLFVHDGFSMKIYIDGVLTAYRGDIETPVFGVQSAGVMIGRRHKLPAKPYAFDGDMDRIRIWKFDPYARHRRFFCREMDFRAEACWRGLFRAIERARQDEKTRAEMEQALMCLENAEKAFIRAFEAKGQGAMKKARQFARQYQSLVCANDLSGLRMKSLIAGWNAWTSEDLAEAYANYLAAVAACLPLLKHVMPDAASCLKNNDPDFQAFLGLLGGTCAEPPEPPGYDGPDGEDDKSIGYGTSPSPPDETKRHDGPAYPRLKPGGTG
jgi:Concanavalin A-like lectin/glucanases superfamily